jgi:hypothetical protein
MAIQERVTDYTVAVLRNDIVDFRRIVRLTTESGHKAFIGFPDQPPADWLQVSGATSTALLPSADFDAMFALLQSESPLFFTAINLFGIRALNLSSGLEAPGEGPADPDALAQLMARARSGAEAGPDAAG